MTRRHCRFPEINGARSFLVDKEKLKEHLGWVQNP